MGRVTAHIQAVTALLTPVELAARWQRRVEWIRQHAAEFGGFKVGGYRRFDPDDIERYENRRKTRGPLAVTELSMKRRGWT